MSKEQIVEKPGKIEKERGEEISVPVSLLEKINKKIEDLESQATKQTEEIERLTQAADVGRLALYDSKNSKNLIRTVKLNVINGKIVIGWKMVKDEVGVNEKGVLVEDQTILVFLDNGEGEKVTSAEMSYISFSRAISKLTANIIKKSTDNDGNETIVVETPDGRQVEINVKFIN